MTYEQLAPDLQHMPDLPHIPDFQHIDDDECHRFQGTMELIGRRWSSAILLALTRGAERFSEIRAVIPGLSDRLLSQRAKELEAAGLIERRVVASTPVQISYHLTRRGADLMESLQPLAHWGQQWGDLPR